MGQRAEADGVKIRQELKNLGERRKQMADDTDQLMRDVETTLKRAYGTVSVSEAARLLGLHRTTVYRVYQPHG